MTLDQLRIFLEVATHEHVTKAAQTLNMTQSAVSAAIAMLEARHSVTLFNRVGRRIELTQAGRLFMAEARMVIQRAEQAERLLADLGSTASGVLRLHASQTVASYWLPPYLVRYRELHPRVDIKLHLGNTATVAAGVLEGKSDLGLVEGKVETSDLINEVVASDRIVVIVNKHHPWADGRQVKFTDLPMTTWIMREPGSGTRAEFEANLRTIGVDPATLPTDMELPSNEACLAAVAVGRSATVLSKRAVFPRMAEGLFHEVNLDLPIRNFSILRHSERHTPRSVQAMLEMLRSPECRDEIV